MPRREVLTSMPERLRAAAAEVAEDAVALKLSRKRREQLVREAIDREGMCYAATAAAAGITSPRVAAILGTVDDDDQGDE